MIKVKYHPQLAAGRWAQMTLAAQMANIGSEVHRTYSNLSSGKTERARVCFERALELFDLSLDAKPREAAIRELCLARDYFCEMYLNKNLEELAALDKYFYAFALEYNKEQQNGK